MLKKIADRLQQTRQALGFSVQSEFAKAIGVSATRWNNFESGERRITLDVAIKVRQRFNVSLDWIYFGDPSSLPFAIAKNLPERVA